jgi:hypothetical protein
VCRIQPGPSRPPLAIISSQYSAGWELRAVKLGHVDHRVTSPGDFTGDRCEGGPQALEAFRAAADLDLDGLQVLLEDRGRGSRPPPHRFERHPGLVEPAAEHLWMHRGFLSTGLWLRAVFDVAWPMGVSVIWGERT